MLKKKQMNRGMHVSINLSLLAAFSLVLLSVV